MLAMSTCLFCKIIVIVILLNYDGVGTSKEMNVVCFVLFYFIIILSELACISLFTSLKKP